MLDHTRVAAVWIRQIIAKYSPEFYKWVWLQKFRSPKTNERVLFHSLPPEEQKKIHDEWAARRQGPHQTQMPRREFQRLRERAQDAARGFDPEEEQAAAKADRKEMAQAIKALKDKGVPARIVDKERRRLIQEMESRRLKRKKEREKKMETAQTPVVRTVAARWIAQQT